MNDYASKLVKGAGIIFIISVFISALGYFIRIILAQKLTTEEFGLFFAVYNFVLMIGWIKGFGTGSSLQKFIPEFHIKNEQDKVKSILVFVLIFSIVSSIFFLLVFYFFPEKIINSYFKSHAAKSLLLLLFLFVSIDSISKIISSYFLSRHFSFLFSSRELIFRVAVLILLLLFATLNPFKVSIIYITAVLLTLIINSISFFQHFHFFQHKTTLTKEFMKKVFNFSLPLTVKDFFEMLTGYVDNLLLVYFRPLAEVAIYNVILPTADMLLLFGRPFGRIMFPLSSELWALDKQEQISFLVRKIHKYLFLLTIPIVVVILVFSGFILKLVFGADYAEGSFGLQVLMLGFLFSGLNITNYSVLLGIGKPKEATKVMVFTNILNFVLCLLLIPFFGKFNKGYLGAVISTAFCSFLAFLFFWHYLKRFIGYIIPIRDWFFMIIIGFSLFIFSPIILGKITDIYIQIIFFTLIVLIFYPLFLILFGVTSKKEINNLFNLLFKKRVIEENIPKI